jgi:hypothetical protein
VLDKPTLLWNKWLHAAADEKQGWQVDHHAPWFSCFDFQNMKAGNDAPSWLRSTTKHNEAPCQQKASRPPRALGLCKAGITGAHRA